MATNHPHHRSSTREIMIKLEDLQQGAWYYGDGRTGPVALWSNGTFYSFNYEWKQYTVAMMDYEKGFQPYAIIDSSFTPEVLNKVHLALSAPFGSKFHNPTSLQELSVIQEFMEKFMEVGTLLLNVETQGQLSKQALIRIASSGDMTAEEMKTFARNALREVHLVQYRKD